MDPMHGEEDVGVAEVETPEPLTTPDAPPPPPASTPELEPAPETDAELADITNKLAVDHPDYAAPEPPAIV